MQKATEAKQNTERQQIIETARIDILGKQAENHGSLSEQELTVILTSNDYTTKGTLSDNGEATILEKTLTSSDGKYEIPVSKIYNGTLTNTEPSIPTEYSSETKETLIAGKYVTYNGNLYRVLYDIAFDESNGTAYGIEIVSVDSLEMVTLGANDPAGDDVADAGELGTPERALWSYNNAISILNKKAEAYKTNLAERARCIGSDPSNPYSESGYYIYSDDFNDIAKSYLLRNTDTNCTRGENTNTPKKDYEQLQTIGASQTTDGTVYWFASRLTNASAEYYMRIGFFNGDLWTHHIGNIGDTGDLYSQSDSIPNGLRPVIKLKTSVNIQGGNGTSDSPYQLGI